MNAMNELARIISLEKEMEKMKTTDFKLSHIG